MGRKRKSPASGHRSRSNSPERSCKDNSEMDLRNVPHENVMENRKCSMSNMGTDNISIERSMDYVTPSDKTPWNGDSPLGTGDEYPPVKTFMRKKISDTREVNCSIQTVVGPPERKCVSENLNAVSIADNQDSAIAEKDGFSKVSCAELKEKLSASLKESTSTSSSPVVQNQCSPDSLVPLDFVMDSKNNRITSNNCSYPIVGSTDELTGGDKCHSNSCVVKLTYTKKNKAANRNGGDNQLPGNKTFADNSSLIETADIGAPSKNNAEASTSSNLILVTKNESSSEKSDDNFAQMSGIIYEDASNSIILEDISSRNYHMYKRRGKTKSLGTNSAASLPGTSEKVSVLKSNDEASLSNKQASAVEKETSALTNSFADCKMETMFQQTDAAPKFMSNKVTDNSQSVDTTKNNVTPNIDTEDSDSNNKCASQALPNKTNLSSKMSSNSCQLEVISSIQVEKCGGQDGNLSGFEYDIQQIFSDATCTLQPVSASADANGSNRVSTSDEFERRITEVKYDINESAASNSAVVQKTESWLNSGEAQQCHVITVEGSLKLLPASLKEGASVPPSPIRGLVQEPCSPNLPMKQQNQLDSCNEGCVSFSFQIQKLRDDSLNQSGEASKLGIRDRSESVKPAIDKDNALDYKYKLTDAPTGQEKEPVFSPMSHIAEDVVSSSMTKDWDENLNLAALSAAETLLSCSRKKLIVLDLNGLLADINQDYRYAHKAQKRVGGKLAVFKRPFCDDFLKFCFERFHVGVWSSRRRHNVDTVVDYLMGNLRHKLLFCWDQSKCTDTGYGTVENAHKPLVLKELKKLWNKEERDLPWEKGEYSPFNTLLVDDSPYKAICNPPHTAIFPYPYRFTDENDNSLGPGGELRVYLEGLAMADDVQLYVRGHPFGQKAIADSNPSWDFYHQIMDKIQKSSSLTA